MGPGTALFRSRIRGRVVGWNQGDDRRPLDSGSKLFELSKAKTPANGICEPCPMSLKLFSYHEITCEAPAHGFGFARIDGFGPYFRGQARAIRILAFEKRSF